MVIDLSKFRPLTNLDDDALWIVEQIPGLVVGHDQTAILRTGLGPSLIRCAASSSSELKPIEGWFAYDAKKY